MLKFQRPDGIFHDFINEPDSFTDGTSAMMLAAFIYRGLREGWLERKYKQHADIARKTMNRKVDEFGIIHGVCGAPTYRHQGTAIDAQAAWIMMDTWARK